MKTACMICGLTLHPGSITFHFKKFTNTLDLNFGHAPHSLVVGMMPIASEFEERKQLYRAAFIEIQMTKYQKANHIFDPNHPEASIALKL